MSSLPGPSTSVTRTKKIDWSKYAKRYRQEWEKLPVCNGWLVRALGGDITKARCRLCRKEFRAHLGDIKKHAKSEAHANAMKVTMSGKVMVEGYRVGPKYTRMHNPYRQEWEDEPECEGWLTRSEYGARCNACNCELLPKLNELKRHGRSQKHLRSMTELWDKVGLGQDVREDLKPSFQPWQLPDIKKRDFELKVSLVSGLECGFRGVKELCAVLEEKHGPDIYDMTSSQSQMLFRLVLVPYFRYFLRKDMEDTPFSLILDDAANLLPSGEIGACIYYFSRQRQGAVSTYLGLLRFDREDINVLVESINEMLQSWELYGHNMVSIITDGVAEVCCDRDALLTLLVPTCPNVLHVHSSFSSIAHAFHSAVKDSLPPSVPFVLRECYNWFADSLERQHKYREVMEQVGFDPRKNSKQEQDVSEENDLVTDEERGMLASDGEMERFPPSASQWLRIADYTTGLFLHYDALRSHFENVAKDEGCFSASILAREFGNEDNRLYFTVLQPILTEICDLHQHVVAAAKDPLEDSGPGLCQQLESIFVTLASQILKPEVLVDKSVEDLFMLDLGACPDFLLTWELVKYGQNFTTILDATPLSDEQKNEVRKNSSAFLKSLFVGLQLAFKDTFTIMRSSNHFMMPNFLEKSLDDAHLCPPFFDQDEEYLENIKSKYRLMKMLDWKNKRSTFLFWQEVHDFGDATGNFPLRVVSNGVWKMLCVPIFNEEISKTFKLVKHMRKSLRFLNSELSESVLICKIGLKRLGRSTAHFQPPPELLKD